MARDTGEFEFEKDDSGGHHWRCSLTADHQGADNTDYNELSDDDWKRYFVSGWFTEDPDGPYGTDTFFEEYRASIEPRDDGNTETRSPEPDPNESPHNNLFDLSISHGIGPISISHSFSESSMNYTDNYRGNLYWQHWEVPSGDMPITNDDSHGASVILDTTQPPGDEVTVAGWTSSSYTWNDPNGGTGFTDTDAIGGFCHFTVVDR